MGRLRTEFVGTQGREKSRTGPISRPPRMVSSAQPLRTHSANSTSPCPSTVRVAYSFLSGGYPCLRRIRLTSQRRLARTFRSSIAAHGLARTTFFRLRTANSPLSSFYGRSTARLCRFMPRTWSILGSSRRSPDDGGVAKHLAGEGRKSETESRTALERGPASVARSSAARSRESKVRSPSPGPAGDPRRVAPKGMRNIRPAIDGRKPRKFNQSCTIYHSCH